MSNSIDERIVRLQFDNKSFRKNAEDSLKALEAFDNQAQKITKSKGLLDLGKASKSMSDLGKSANNIRLDALSKSIDAISNSFTKLGSIGHRMLENLADDAYRYGKQMIKSLSIDQITAGYDKYEQKTSAVQTIMAATAKDFKDQGEQMKYVNGQLEKLQWFTDETSYNFNDMVSSIGKFTGAGVKLDDAVSAMQGVANWAAKSGVNATRASGAYYNLSQAIGLGYVQLMDWRSIQNLNMDTMEFKDLVLETAASMGTLKKQTDGSYKTLKKHEVTSENFANNLSDQWFTADVLMSVLEKYGMASEKLYKVTDDLGLTATEMLGYIEDYQNGSLDLAEISEDTGKTIEDLTKIFEEFNTEEMRFSLSALRAAQEAKTFNEALDATKDAVSSQWSQTFELIFGDYQQAKKLWSMTAEYLWDIFAASGESRNELLEGWKDLGGQDSVFKIFENTFESVLRIISLVKDAWQSVFPPMTAERLYGITEQIRQFTEDLKNFLDYTDEATTSVSENGEMIIKTETRTQKWSKTMKNVSRILQGVFSIIKIGLTVVRQLGKSALNFIKSIFPKNGGLLDSLAGLGDSLVELRKKVEESDFFEKWNEKLKPVASSLGKVFTSIKNSLVELWTNLKEKFAKSEVFQKAKQSIKDFFSAFVTTKIPAWIESAGNWITTNVPTAINKIVEFTESAINFFQTNEKVQKVWGSISKFFTDFKTKANEFFKVVGDSFKAAYNVDTSGYDSIGEKIKARLEPLRAIYDWIKKNIFGIEDSGEVKEDAESSKGFFQTIKEKIEKGWKDLTTTFTEAGDGIKEGATTFFDKVKIAYDWIKDKVVELDLPGMLRKAFDIYVMMKAGKIFTNFSNAAIGFSNASQTFANGFATWARAKLPVQAPPQKTPLGEQLKNIGIAVGLIVASLYVLSTIKEADLLKAETALFGIGAFLIGMMVIPGLFNKKDQAHFADIGKGMRSLALGLLGLVLALKIMSGIKWETFLNGLGKMALVLAVIIGFSRLSKGQGAGKGFFGLAMSMLIFAGVIKIFSMMKWSNVVKGTAILSALLIMLGVFMQISGGGNNLGKFSQFLGLALLIVVLAGSIKVLGSMNFGSILKGVFAMGAVIVGLIALTKYAGKTGKLSGMALALIGIAGSIFLFYELIQSLKDLPETKILAISGGFLAMMGGLWLMANAVKTISTITLGGAIKGSLGFAAAIVIITGIVLALSELYSLLDDSQQDQIEGAVEDFGNFLQKVGTAIGKFFGGLGGGVVQGFTADLPQVGTDLSNFMNNADDFLQGLKKVDADMVAGAGNLASIYGTVSLESLVDWLLSGAGHWSGPVQTFSNNLPTLAQGVVDFANKAKDINEDGVKKGKDALDKISSIKFPDTSTFENIINVSDMGNFANKLGPLGEGLSSFSNSTKDVQKSKIENAKEALDLLGEFATTKVPDTSTFENFLSISDLENFSNRLGNLGSGLASFYTNINSVFTGTESDKQIKKKFENATEAAGLIGDFAIELPNNSFLENLLKVSDMSNFAANLGTLGTGIKDFHDNLGNNIDFGYAGEAATFLKDLVPSVTQMTERMSSGISKYDYSSLKTFSKNSGGFAEGLATIVDKMSDIPPSNAKKASDVLSKTKELFDYIFEVAATYTSFSSNKTVNKYNFEQFEKFGDNAENLGTGISSIITSLTGEGVDLTAAGRVAEALKVMVPAISEIYDLAATIGGAGINDKAFETLGLGINNFVSALLGKNPEKYVSSAFTGPIKEGMAVAEDLSGEFGDLTLANNVKIYSEAISNLSGAYLNLLNVGTDVFGIGASNISTKIENLGIGLKGFVEQIPSVTEMDDASVAAVNGIANLVNSLANAFKGDSLELEDIWESNWGLFLNSLITSITETEDFSTMADTFFAKISEAMTSSESSVTTTATNIATNIATAMSNQYGSFYNAGYNLVWGFANGISNNSGIARQKAYALGRAAVTGLMQGIDANSPSKEAARAGNYFGEGFQFGIQDYTKTIQNDSYRLGSEALTGLINAVAQAKNVLENGEVDMNPVISPVLDLSNVREGAKNLNDMLYFNSGVLSTSLGRGVNAFKGSINNPDLYFEKGSLNNTDIVEAVKGVQYEVATMKEAMAGMGVYLNGKTLVGGIKTDMNNELGAQSRRDGRGN